MIKIRTWSEEVLRRYKPKSVIGMPIRVAGKTCIIKAFHKDYVEVIECNSSPRRYVSYDSRNESQSMQ